MTIRFGMKQAISEIITFLDTKMGPDSGNEYHFRYPVQRTANPLIPDAWTARIRRDRDYIEKKAIGEVIDHFLIGLDITVEALYENDAWDLLDELCDQVKYELDEDPKVTTPNYPLGAFLEVVVLGITYYSAPGGSEQDGLFAMGTVSLDMRRIRENRAECRVTI